MKISLKAYSKINPAIRVKEKLPNGYHEVDMIMQSVSIFDEIEVETTEKIGEIKLITSDEDLISDDNTVVLAVKYFDEVFKLPFGVKIKLSKNIPVAAGMAGGSADAAGVLTALNILCGKPLSLDELSLIAKKVGADVPFMLTGGTKRIGGIGEKLKSVPDFPDCFIVLIKNADKLSTGYMYNKLDNSLRMQTVDIDALEKALESRNLAEISEYIGNDFADVWGNEVHSVMDRLKKLGASASSVTGSGPTVFGLFSDEKKVKSVYEELKEDYKEIFLAYPVKKAIEISEN